MENAKMQKNVTLLNTKSTVEDTAIGDIQNMVLIFPKLWLRIRKFAHWVVRWFFRDLDPDLEVWRQIELKKMKQTQRDLREIHFRKWF